MWTRLSCSRSNFELYWVIQKLEFPFRILTKLENYKSKSINSLESVQNYNNNSINACEDHLLSWFNSFKVLYVQTQEDFCSCGSLSTNCGVFMRFTRKYVYGYVEFSETALEVVIGRYASAWLVCENKKCWVGISAISRKKKDKRAKVSPESFIFRPSS